MFHDPSKILSIDSFHNFIDRVPPPAAVLIVRAQALQDVLSLLLRHGPHPLHPAGATALDLLTLTIVISRQLFHRRTPFRLMSIGVTAVPGGAGHPPAGISFEPAAPPRPGMGDFPRQRPCDAASNRLQSS